VPYDNGTLDYPRSVVITFLQTPDGRTRCRVTDVATRRSWMLDGARELRNFIYGDLAPRENATAED